MGAELDTTMLEAALSRATGSRVRLASSPSASGAAKVDGSVNQVRIVELTDGRRFFVKTRPSPPPGFFGAEAQGLETLERAGVLRVPRVVALVEGDDSPAFLILEAIEAGRPGEGFFETFGRQLAELHRTTTSGSYGFARDNFLGATPQLNRWNEDWCEFWRRYRLGYQLDLARRRGVSDPVLDQLGDRLLDRLDELIASPEEPPCLIHGDLWSGNFLADAEGVPVLIDPAVYYGRREAELAMTRLFGGFDKRFYAAYEEAWPLAPGAEERLELYKLYHLLNHLNLFGGGYRANCIETLRRFV